MTPTPSARNWPGPGHGRDHDRALLAAGGTTGWWNEHGQPAPWPDDFLDPGSDWHPTRNEELTTPEPGQPPF